MLTLRPESKTVEPKLDGLEIQENTEIGQNTVFLVSANILKYIVDFRIIFLVLCT